MRSSLALVCIRSAAVALPLGIVIACGSTGTGGGFAGSSGGNSSGSSGSGVNSGSNGGGTGSSGGTTGSSGGTAGNSGATTGTSGGATGAGGGTTGSSGATTGSSGATTGSSGATTGSVTGTTGTSGTIVTVIDAGPSACGTPGPNVLSDFEQDTGILVQQGGRTGWWYVYADPMAGSQTPAVATGPIAVAAAPADAKTLTGETCNKFSLTSTASGHTAYVGFGATFIPGAGTNKTAYANLANFDGIQFDIKGAAGAQPMYFELLTTDTQPTTLGGLLATNANPNIAINNNRGYYLTGAGATATNTSTSIPTTTTTVYVPFSMLIPRHFPAPTPASCGSEFCQAPTFVPGHALGFQFSAYPDMNNTNGSYNLTVDNVSLYTGDNGLNPASPTAAAPAFNDGAVGFASCKSSIPTFAGTKTASGKYLQAGYNNWKAHFVSGAAGSPRKVIRPENGNDTVSEGIGYGMLLAVYFNDQPLFNDLWSYSQQSKATGNLMTWCIPAGANSCNPTGGTATDADEDMAFAMLEAGKKWGNATTITGGGTYTSTAGAMITQIAGADMDFTDNLPKGGSNYMTTNGTGQLNNTNPSYFAPAYYHIFASADPTTANATKWTAVETNVISVISALSTKLGNGHGLVPAWCASNCTVAASNGATTDELYQYDAHRVPWRLGAEYCWFANAAAKSYLTTLTGFFSGINTAGGIDSVYDIYNLTGGADTPTAQPNSMSSVGTASVGAMAAGTAGSFVQAGWQFLLDGGNRATLDVLTTGQSPYSYFNATVGLLSALTLSGNFYPM